MDAPQGQGSPDEQANRQAIEAVERGVKHLENEQGDQAIDCFTEAIRLCPALANAYFARACAYDDRGDYDLAIAEYTEVIRLVPGRFSGYRLRGSVYEKKGEKAKADGCQASVVVPASGSMT